MKVKFLPTCPTCLTDYKVVVKCQDCGKYICSVCEFERLCFDCYVKHNSDRDKSYYFEEKYKMEVTPLKL